MVKANRSNAELCCGQISERGDEVIKTRIIKMRICLNLPGGRTASESASKTASNRPLSVTPSPRKFCPILLELPTKPHTLILLHQ